MVLIQLTCQGLLSRYASGVWYISVVPLFIQLVDQPVLRIIAISSSSSRRAIGAAHISIRTDAAVSPSRRQEACARGCKDDEDVLHRYTCQQSLQRQEKGKKEKSSTYPQKPAYPRPKPIIRQLPRPPLIQYHATVHTLSLIHI